MGVFPGALAHLDEQDDKKENEQEEDDATRSNRREHSHFGAKDAIGVARRAGRTLIHVV